MEMYDALNPLVFRYMPRDVELNRKVDSYENLHVITKIKRIIPEVLVPRLNSLESKLKEIAIENKGKEVPRRVSGQHEGKIAVEEVFKTYANRLRNRICIIDRLGFHLNNNKTYSNENVSDIAYQVLSAFSVEANIGNDVRQLFRSDIDEYRYKEYERTRVGSSTMPHKINPVEFENIVSLWKAYMPRIVTFLTGQITEHQGDSTSEHVPYCMFELLCLVSYTTNNLENLLMNLEIKAQNGL